MLRFNGRLAGPVRSSHPDGRSEGSGHDASGFSSSLSSDGGSHLRARIARLDGFVPESPGAQPDSGPLFRRRELPSGGGVADGGAVGETGSGGLADRLGFARAVPPRGYAWWYVDGLSDDGQSGITLIAFIGSVFSPYYAWSGRRAPENHCALNVALYGRRGHRWAMTERGRRAVTRDRSSFVIGPSSMAWDGGALTFDIDEVTVPIPSRIKGTVRLIPTAVTERSFALDSGGRHRWWPVAPCSRIEVELERPALRWSGSGYFDLNDGSEPLEDGFSHWDWARASFGDGKGAAMLYDVIDRRGRHSSLTLRADDGGSVQEVEPPKPVRLPRTLWLMRRGTRADGESGVSVKATLEDAPFYARSLLSTKLLGQDTLAMHESLSLDRFRTQIVKSMLPYRMPRRIF
jgi:carotenoid 1,2-hydratase